MRWFGRYWDSPVCNNAEQTGIPLGMRCIRCAFLIRETQRGFLFPEVLGDSGDTAYHLRCFLLSVTTIPGAKLDGQLDPEDRAEALYACEEAS